MISHSLVSRLLLISSLLVSAKAEAHSSVQDLTTENFDTALADPANGFWLLKFYAPWCGHCKKMAPTLDKVAVYLKGKMAIGKIDCTQHKSLCDRYSVNGFPTLKVYRDGAMFDYPSERDADSIINFAEKMSSSAVVNVSSHHDAIENAKKGGNGVIFMAYDPVGKGDTLEEMLQSSVLLQVFGQIARKQQAHASFGLIDSNMGEDELLKFGAGTKPFIAKVEDDVKSVAYTGAMNSPEFLDFVKGNNLALVTKLGSDNFRTVSRMGKPLAIGVIDPDSPLTKDFVAELRSVAAHGKPALVEKVFFGILDGVKWAKFVTQFGVESSNLPSFFILDAQKKTYWDQPDHTGKDLMGMEDLLSMYVAGNLPPKAQGSGKRQYPFYLNPAFMLGVVAIIMTLYFVLPLGADEMEEIGEADPSAKASTSNNEKQDTQTKKHN